MKRIRRTLADTKKIVNELTEWSALGDWRTFFIHRDRLGEVTAADVERVAREYLIQSNRTAGLFLPTKDPRRVSVPPTPNVAELVKDYRSPTTLEGGEPFLLTPKNIDQHTLRMRIEPGIEVALLSKETRGELAFAEFRFHFGSEESLRGHTEALRVIPALLQRGTTKRNYQRLRDEIDRLQSEISLSGGVGTFGVSIESDREHILETIALAAEMLQQPAFDPSHFAMVKSEQLTKLREELSSPQERCFDALRRALYPWPADSIHYIPTLEERIERVESVSLEEVKALHERFYGSGHVEISVVGDFERGKVLSTIGMHFA